MAALTPVEELILEMENEKNNAIAFNTSFNHTEGLALLKYTKDKGNKFVQDTIRNAVNIFLTKQGYINK